MIPNKFAKIIDIMTEGVLAEDPDTQRQVLCPYSCFREAAIDHRGKLESIPVPKTDIPTKIEVDKVVCFSEGAPRDGFLTASEWFINSQYQETLEELISNSHFLKRNGFASVGRPR